MPHSSSGFLEDSRHAIRQPRHCDWFRAMHSFGTAVANGIATDSRQDISLSATDGSHCFAIVLPTNGLLIVNGVLEDCLQQQFAVLKARVPPFLLTSLIPFVQKHRCRQLTERCWPVPAPLSCPVSQSA